MTTTRPASLTIILIGTLPVARKGSLRGHTRVLSEIVETDVRRVNVALSVHSDPRRRCAGVRHRAHVARIWDQVLQSPGNRVADHDGPVVRAGCWPKRRLARSDALVGGANVDVVARVDIHRAWLAELFPRRDECTFLIEDLHSIVLAI